MYLSPICWLNVGVLSEPVLFLVKRHFLLPMKLQSKNKAFGENTNFRLALNILAHTST